MKNLFVGNMSFQTSEDDLKELFKPFGQVARIHIAMDRETGRARGFAFVEMPNDEEAAKAMAALDGKEVGGRNLKVNEARPKAYRGSFRGAGSGRPSGGPAGRPVFNQHDSQPPPPPPQPPPGAHHSSRSLQILLR